MHDMSIKIIGAQQPANYEFKMRAIKSICIHFGTAVHKFQQPSSRRFATLFPQEECSAPKQRTVIKMVP